MKKRIAFLLLVCCLLLAGCGAKEKDAIQAKCDEFVKTYEGTVVDGYTVESIDYTIYRATVVNSSVLAEITWRIELSGEFDMKRELIMWTGRVEELLEHVEMPEYTFDVFYYDKEVGDLLTVVINNESAWTGAHNFYGYEYPEEPPLLPTMGSFSVLMSIWFILLGMVLLIIGWIKGRKNWLMILGGGAMMALAIMVASFAERDISNLIYLILIALTLMVGTIILLKYLANKNKKRHTDFYDKCLSRNITDPTMKKHRDALMLIAKNYGITDEKKALTAYRKGRKLYLAQQDKLTKILDKEQEQARKEMEKKEDQARAEERYEYTCEKEKVQTKGKEKYLRSLKRRLSIAKGELNTLENTKVGSPYISTQGSDWAIAGGIASGIAGPAAGLAVALETQQRNAEHKKNAEAWNQMVAMAGITKESLQEHHDLEVDAQRSIVNDYAALIDKMNNTLLDDSDQEGKLKLLKFNISGKLTQNGLLSLSVTPKQVGNATVLDSPAVLDGSVKILVQDEKGKTIGEAYYNAPGFDEYDLSKVGFKLAEKRTVIAVPLKGDTFTSDQNLRYKVVPACLWAIEYQ